jgi:predicted RNase H-like nuclease
VSDVPPLTWKPFIGYKNVSAKEKAEWAVTMEQKEVKKKAEFERKERVKRIIDQRIPNHGCTDHDIIDSMGIGIWGLAHLL